MLEAGKIMVKQNAVSGDTKLIRGGKEYFDLLLSLIGQATKSIHLQTYIYEEDETGRLVADALLAAAKRNVDVYLLADGYASKGMSKRFKETLREGGVQLRYFQPFIRQQYFYFGRRMHHKIFVADAQHALVGGINIADRYNDVQGEQAWLDFAALVHGAPAFELYKLCCVGWNSISSKDPISNSEKSLPPNSSDIDNDMIVHLRRNDWVNHKNEISGTYINLFRHAKSEITIMCSYFLPGKIVRRLLKVASARGVKIKIVIAGQSDFMISKHAERWLYDWLLRNNIELYEYQPTILHAKIAVCDHEWVTIGSYNLNNLSAYASIELNLDIINEPFASDVKEQLEHIIQKDCVSITRERHKHSRNAIIQFIRWCSYQLLRMVLYLFTFYFKQKQRKK